MPQSKRNSNLSKIKHNTAVNQQAAQQGAIPMIVGPSVPINPLKKKRAPLPSQHQQLNKNFQAAFKGQPIPFPGVGKFPSPVPAQPGGVPPSPPPAQPGVPPVSPQPGQPGGATKLAKQQAAAQQKAMAAGRLQKQEQLQRLAIGQNVFQSAAAIPGQAQTVLERAPQPGSIALPLLVLLLLYLLIIPVNGHSRLEWLWMVFIGDAGLPSGVSLATGGPAGTGGGPPPINPSAPSPGVIQGVGGISVPYGDNYVFYTGNLDDYA